MKQKEKKKMMIDDDDDDEAIKNVFNKALINLALKLNRNVARS